MCGWHEKSVVEEGATIGPRTRIWAWAHVLSGARIGADCNICDHTFIEGKVVIGDRVTVKCNVSIWDGVTIADDVFIGPSVAFTNDKFPRSREWANACGRTRVERGASIGANATILPVRIGVRAMVGAGSVVTCDVPDYAIVVGNPARIVGYVDAAPVNGAAVDASVGAGVGAELRTGGRLLPIPLFEDMRGALNVLELESLVPFPVKRMFYTYGMASSRVRGEHALRTCQQLLIAVHGSLNIILDDGKTRESVFLDNPSVGLFVPACRWVVQYKHSADCVLLVLASQPYEDGDYIRDYEEFLRCRSVRVAPPATADGQAR